MHFIFDLDGTLIDSVPDIHHNINILLQEEGLPSLTLNQTTSFVGNGSKKLVERAFDHFNKKPDSDSELEMLSERFVAHYMDNLTTNTKIYPYVIEVLDYLSLKGHVLSLCTNKPLKPTLAILDELNLAQFFQIVTGGDSYDQRKPSPLPLLKTIEQTNISLENCIMVGDSIYDIEAGQAANIQTILLTYGYTHGDLDKIHPTYICKSFNDIKSLF
ncbi:phosphoglycolate phosphatase [Curvivirga sp.]|uniref:phosphoglycolate phosphatase n=1 Tax=Curvivirga sp. TaxID=2856848 RepID=UPI003B595076